MVGSIVSEEEIPELMSSEDSSNWIDLLFHLCGKMLRCMHSFIK